MAMIDNLVSLPMSRGQFLKLTAAAGAWAATGARAQTSASSMHRRPIPASGEMLPVVGCGTWQTFDDDPRRQDELAEVLRTLFASGGSLIDSSPMYGAAEAVAGRLLTRIDGHSKAFVATKVWTRGRQAGIDQMTESERLLQHRPIDLMQIHNLVRLAHATGDLA
ncbi:MAG: aldo/keto reductase [Rhodocyclaceae bacterium]